MPEEEQPSIIEAILGTLGVLAFMGLIVGLWAMTFAAAGKMRDDLQRELTTPQGYLVGRVKSVETWTEGPYVVKNGNTTLTLSVEDRCKVTFEDGRSKTLLGMPTEPIPTDHDVAVIWAGYNVYLKTVPASEFDPRSLEEPDNAGTQVPDQHGGVHPTP